MKYLIIVLFLNPNFPLTLLGGNPQRSASRPATVTVTVTDVNDSPPSFSQDEYVYEVYEELPAGTEVGAVSLDMMNYNLVWNWLSLKDCLTEIPVSGKLPDFCFTYSFLNLFRFAARFKMFFFPKLIYC